jgi:hypothetical protein
VLEAHNAARRCQHSRPRRRPYVYAAALTTQHDAPLQTTENQNHTDQAVVQQVFLGAIKKFHFEPKSFHVTPNFQK